MVKDLTFEAKDFKMSPRGHPRGQGRPLSTPPLISLNTRCIITVRRSIDSLFDGLETNARRKRKEH